MIKSKVSLERGKTYRVKLTSGRWTEAEFLGDETIGGDSYMPRFGPAGGIRRTIRRRTRYNFRNIVSGRTISVKSMAKIKAAGGAQ